MTKPTVCISRCQTKYPEQPKLLTAGSFTPPRLLLPAFSSTKFADRPPMPTIKFLGRLSPAKSLITTPIISVNLIETPVSSPSPLPCCPQCRSKLLSKKKKLCNVCGLLLRSEQLLAGGKLSVAAWQEIQMLLGISPLLCDLTDKQTGAVRQILDYFVAHCPISRQTTFGDDELKHWLLNHLPAAHRSYLSFFQLTIENNLNNGGDQRGAPALAAKTKLAATFSGENKPPKQNKDTSGGQRHPVSPAVYRLSCYKR